ncbi:MAG: hypothetical protein EKK53_04740 [Burkholderiales bacterium]|jgi:hypothetical protein|nr:MAG: hypothetical protein EKK53_04740 [Burkholderiales bacterium]
MTTRRIVSLAAFLILGAPVVGYLLYSGPALDGMYLRWITPLFMVFCGLLLLLIVFGPAQPQAQQEPDASREGDGRKS